MARGRKKQEGPEDQDDLVFKALKDKAFRERLIQRPRETLNALAADLGLATGAPDSVDITVNVQ